MKNKIGITLGDPAGIGYEIVAKSLLHLKSKVQHFILIGNKDQYLKVLKILKINDEILKNIDFVDVKGNDIEFGKIQKESGRIAYRSVKEGSSLAMKDEIDALVTAPINKEAWKLAGSEFIDHTTMLKALTNSKMISTIFEVKRLRIIFLTKHISLIEACKQIKKDNIIKGIEDADLSLKLLGIENGKIAVSALNPHGGEGGLFGVEEVNEIIPAIEECKNKYNVYGPFPADSVFYLAAKGNYDIVLSLYHDQGHIAAKMYDFEKTVSLNVGIPFLRTSVDHGTAYDIAGKGIANEISMLEAIKKSIKYAKKYKENYRKLF